MTVEEDVAALQAEVATLKSRVNGHASRLTAVEAFVTKARAAIGAIWRKHRNRDPTNEEL